jgi:type I restriction enzyme S subunit
MTLNLHPGLIPPNDWRVCKLREVAKLQAGGTPSRSVSQYWTGTIPWIGTGKINFNVITEADEFITEDGLKNSSTRLFPVGTLLLAMIGQGDTRGKVARLGISAATNQNCVGIIPAPVLTSEFLYQYLADRYEAIRNFGNSGGISNLNAGLIGMFDVLLPPLPEQKAIASVLSAWDRAIGQTNALIAATQRLKQGLMQQLLTGKRRFPKAQGNRVSDRWFNYCMEELPGKWSRVRSRC